MGGYYSRINNGPTLTKTLQLGLLLATLLLSFLWMLSPPAVAGDPLRPLEGRLSIEVEDYADHARLRHWMQDTQGRRIELQFVKRPKWLRGGQHIRAQGQLSGRKLLVNEGAISLLQQGEQASSTIIASESDAEAISGVRTILVSDNFISFI